MTPNPGSGVVAAAAAAVVAFTLLGSPLPTSSFVPATSRGQVPRHSSRRPSPPTSPPPLSSSPRMSATHNCRRQQPHSCFIPTATTTTTTTGERQHQQRQRRPSLRSWPSSSSSSSSYRGVGAGTATPLSLGGMDDLDIDPLEEGPDPDAVLLQGEPEMLRQQQEEEEYDEELAAAAATTASAKKAPTKKQIAEEAVAAAVDTMGEAGGAGDVTMAPLKTSMKKTARTRADPLMPKGGVPPTEWPEMEDLADGVRGILVVCHTGLPRDRRRASEVMQAVKDRYGHLIHTFEWWDDDPELDDDAREEMGTFEVWLEGPTVVHYHERADGKIDLDDVQLEKILDDIECRVVDEAILGLYVNEDFQFRLPGFRAIEQRNKQFPVL